MAGASRRPEDRFCFATTCSFVRGGARPRRSPGVRAAGSQLAARPAGAPPPPAGPSPRDCSSHTSPARAPGPRSDPTPTRPRPQVLAGTRLLLDGAEESSRLVPTPRFPAPQPCKQSSPCTPLSALAREGEVPSSNLRRRKSLKPIIPKKDIVGKFHASLSSRAGNRFLSNKLNSEAVPSPHGQQLCGG